MPLRINKITSNVQITGVENRLSDEEIFRIVNIVLARIREEQEHQNRVSEESKIRNQASEIEPY